MSFRIKLDDQTTIECDTLEELLQVKAALTQTATQPVVDEVDEPTELEEEEEPPPTPPEPEPARDPEPEPEPDPMPVIELAPPPKKRPPSVVPATGGNKGLPPVKTEAYRQAAVAFLIGQGKPMPQIEVCAACGIPPGSSAVAFVPELFVRTDHGLWLVGHPLPEGVNIVPTGVRCRPGGRARKKKFVRADAPQVSLSPHVKPQAERFCGIAKSKSPLRLRKTSPRTDLYIKALRRKLEAIGRPMLAEEIVEQGIVPKEYATTVIDAGPFDRTIYGIWLAGVPLVDGRVEQCRDDIRDLLRDGKELKPAFIAQQLGYLHETVIEALDHEDFGRDLEGYCLVSTKTYVDT